MAKFKHKNGGICEVFSKNNIEKLRKSPDYKEIKAETKNEKETSKNENELKENKK